MNCNKMIADYLEAKGITQKFISNKTGLSQNKISQIVNGTRKVTADELVLIAKALDVNADIFLA